MSSNEYYNDDIVFVNDEKAAKSSIGHVTKKKPFMPNLKSTKNSKNSEISKTDEEETGKLAKLNDDISDDDSSDGNLFDPPQVEMVNVNWFIHNYISDVDEDNTYIEQIEGKNLNLMDRLIEISNIVKLKTDGVCSKVGTIIGLKIYADVVMLGQNKIIKNVDCSNMKWIVPFTGKDSNYNYSYKNWLGEVVDITYEAIIRFYDGARLKVPESALNSFQNNIDNIWCLDDVVENVILVGDACNLKTRKARFLNETTKFNTKWLSKLKYLEIVQIVVEKIIPTSADMQWIYGNNAGNSVVQTAPPPVLKRKELEKLEPIDPYPWHLVNIGDIWYYQLQANNDIYECDPKDDLQKILYKMMNNQLQNTGLETIETENNDADITTNQNKVLCGNHILRPRKKFFVSISTLNKKRMKQRTNNLNNPNDSDSGSNDSSSASNDESEQASLGENGAGSIISKDNNNQHNDKNHQTIINQLNKQIQMKMKPNNYFPVGIITKRSFVDVSWQDGTISRHLSTTQLIPETYNIDEHDFFPGDFVVQKFDPFNPIGNKNMHDFGTILYSNTQDRVATVQWFDNDKENGQGLVKSGEPEEIGVYDIRTLNENHFMIGSEVIIKQESSHNNYPAGYVKSVLSPDQGKLLIRWPDGHEMPIAPTEFLLTVDSVLSDSDFNSTSGILGGGGGGGGINGLDYDCDDDFYDDDSLTSEDLDSDSAGADKPDEFTDDSEWSTTEEKEGDPSADHFYKISLLKARKDLLKIKKTIKKILTILFQNVFGFSMIIQARLPSQIGKMLNVKQMFDDYKEMNCNLEQDLSSEYSISEQKTIIKQLFDIRTEIGLIFKKCSDVEIKRMFKHYRPQNVLVFRNITNFVLSHLKTKNDEKKLCNTNGTRLELTDEAKPDPVPISESEETNEEQQKELIDSHHIKNESEINEEEVQRIIGEYMKNIFVECQKYLKDLDDNIDAWLWEKSDYLKQAEELDEAKLIMEDPNNDVVKDKNIEEELEEECVVLNMLQKDLEESNVELNQVKSSQITNTELINGIESIKMTDDETGDRVEENGPPELCRAVSSDKTMSLCEPIPDRQRGNFIMVESAPESHRFIKSPQPSMSNQKFQKAWKRDLKLLTTSLPKGVIVKGFENRIDLFSVLIEGPEDTPYQYALFFFDIQLGSDYPNTPPNVYFKSLSSERVNPNLYTEGRVCLSLLGTWNGKGTENWDSKVSNLLQLIVSIQGLVLVSEPYYNEAGFEIRKGSEDGQVESQKYNENAINNICQSMVNLLHKPFPVYEKEIREHFMEYGQKLIEVHRYWVGLDSKYCSSNQKLPEFPLAPVSRGFQISLQRHIESLQTVLNERMKEWSVQLEESN